MKQLAFFCIVFAAFTSLAFAEAGDDFRNYTYVQVDPANSSAPMSATLEFDWHGGNSGRGVIHVGHAAVGSLSSCRESDIYFCFISPLVSFAVRKEGAPSGTWQVSGVNYAFLGESTFGLLGLSVPVAVISAEPGDGRTFTLYYSRDKGLVAFSIKEDECSKPSFFFVTTDVGFPF